MSVDLEKASKGLAALIYYEKPKRTEKTKSRPSLIVQYEKLSVDEKERYAIIARNILSYLDKLDMVVVPKGEPGPSAIDIHSQNEILYETIKSQIVGWAGELKLLKKIKNLIPWEEVARRIQKKISNVS